MHKCSAEFFREHRRKALEYFKCSMRFAAGDNEVLSFLTSEAENCLYLNSDDKAMLSRLAFDLRA